MASPRNPSTGSGRAPVVQLTQYQKAWLADHARFKHGRWARQSGKTFGTTLEIADECHAKRTKWVMLSRGERQSKENMEQCALHCRAYGAAAEVLESTYRAQDAEYKQLEIRLPNGSRVIGLPANPDTARGLSANVYLDEFAFHPDSRKIWAALFPTITRGYRLAITSTPQGKSNKFYELEANERFVKHKVDIYDAVAGGLVLRDEQGQAITPEQLRDALGDEEAWQQEYLVQYLDEATAFLTYEQIAAIEDPLAGMPEHAGLNRCFIGGDIGRRRDLTVWWVWEEVGDVLWTREVVTMQGASFAAQEAELDRLIRSYIATRICVDQTGMGEKFVEDAQRRYGSYLVEGVLFTAPVKQDLAFAFKRRVEDRLMRIPVDRAIRDDFHAIKKVTTAAGNIRFDAERTERGHSDRFWSAALGVHAASPGTPDPRVRSLAPSWPQKAGLPVGAMEG